MIDILFYQKVAEFKRSNKDLFIPSVSHILLESYRTKNPTLFSIETTNLCNMQCIMCPRGSGKMTRPLKTMSIETFTGIIEQIKPWTDQECEDWDNFCASYYNVHPYDINENQFFCNVIAKCLTLHGWGDPLLDSTIGNKVYACSKKKIPTYFSCNPANIHLGKIDDVLRSGLTYLKFSFDGVNDYEVKKIRGHNADFSNSYQKVLEVLKLKESMGYSTNIVITMINVDESKEKEISYLKDMFSEHNTYVYLKSEDNQWLKKSKKINPSIHWSEFCQFPWSSFMVTANGDYAICQEDYNADVVFGNISTDSLYDAWNGEKAELLRRSHVYGPLPKKCYICDMRTICKI